MALTTLDTSRVTDCALLIVSDDRRQPTVVNLADLNPRMGLLFGLSHRGSVYERESPSAVSPPGLREMQDDRCTKLTSLLANKIASVCENICTRRSKGKSGVRRPLVPTNSSPSRGGCPRPLLPPNSVGGTLAAECKEASHALINGVIPAPRSPSPSSTVKTCVCLIGNGAKNGRGAEVLGAYSLNLPTSRLDRRVEIQGKLVAELKKLSPAPAVFKWQ